MPEHKTIASALAAAQSNMGKALKQSENPHFRSKYADLGSVMDACLPALNDAGIAVIQPYEGDEFGRYVTTKFIHTSGEVLETRIPLILGKNDMQGLGSALTYARRYGLMALAGIAPEDDDGNAAVQNPPPKGNPQSGAIRDAWNDAVLDDLPEGATSEQKARGYADAIIRDMKGKRSEKTLNAEWDKRQKIITNLQSKYPDLWAEVVEAYDTRRDELADVPTEQIAAE